MTSLSTPTWNHGWLRYVYVGYSSFLSACLPSLRMPCTFCSHKSAYICRSSTVTKQPGESQSYYRLNISLFMHASLVPRPFLKEKTRRNEKHFSYKLHLTCSVLFLSLSLRWMPHPPCPTPLPVTVSWRPPSSTTSLTSCYPLLDFQSMHQWNHLIEKNMTFFSALTKQPGESQS